MMTRKLLIALVPTLFLHAQGTSDQDMDGVPDSIDQCQDTPFLSEVDSSGCPTKALIFPQERHNGSLDIVLGYGYSHDEENIEREEQHVSRLQINYIYNDWIYSANTAYYSASGKRGMLDTIIKVKKRFKPTENFKFSVGAGLKLPTYDFNGNRTDYALYTSAIYYPVSSLSFFGGVNYTFIEDKEVNEPLQNVTAFYLGSGYFFDRDLYMNLSYSYNDTKFSDYHIVHTLSSTLFYQLNEKWYSSLTFSREIDDDEVHNTINLRVGYRLW